MPTHLTSRLVWHDRAWDGHVCDQPTKNVYCVAHQHIREAFRDPAKVEQENKAASVPLAELDGWRPPCSRDPLAFSKLGATTTHEDPLERKALLAVSEDIAPVSSARPHTSGCGRTISASSANGKDSPSPVRRTPRRYKGWVAEPERQKALLSHFWGKLEKKQSLVFFYCKDGHPFAENCNASWWESASYRDRPSDLLRLCGEESEPNGFRSGPAASHTTSRTRASGSRTRNTCGRTRPGEHPLPRYPDADTFNFSYVAEHVTDDVAVGALTRLLQSVQAVKDEGRWQATGTPPSSA